MDPAFILSLVYGHLFSKGVDSAMAVSERHLSEKEFSEILDDFDQKFKKDNDAEITLCGCDMQSVIEKRSLLISLVEKYINQDNAVISRNLKRDFVNTACREIFGHDDWKEEKSSGVVEKYLCYFYDLVFMKETREVPVAYRAVINSYANTQHDINQDHDRRITVLEETSRKPLAVEPGSVDFRTYYEDVERIFTSKKKGEYKNLVGEESDETSYIDAYIREGREQISVMSFLEDWFCNTEPGVILIHGEPGHGKTLLCNKASFEFHKRSFLKEKAKNVVAVSLNTGSNPEIVKDETIKISNALVWGPDNENTFSFEDCRESLLFLDGFDEFIDKAKEANIYNICIFMEKVAKIADTYGIHVVVLSRTIAVAKDLRELDGYFEYYKLSPLSVEQQDEWLKRHKEYDEYREAFINLRNSKGMQELLGVPFLFRLIVNSRFDIDSSNIVELYDNLFTHLMHKRNIYNETLELVNTELMNLAFEIYCTDTNMARMDWNPQWVFAFFVKSDGGERIGFYHRTFYQYFFAKYIYSGIINITDENVESFIGSFAERELDYTVRQYLKMMYKKEDESKIHPNVGKMIDTLVRTEAYINYTPRVNSGDAEKHRILRSKNIYRNTLYITADVSYVIHIPFKGNLDYMVRIFNGKSIQLNSDYSKKADLSGAKLEEADLSFSRLIEADLSNSCLKCTNLSGADLSGADLSGADLSYSCLKYTNLSGANLRRAILYVADLDRAILTRAHLNKTFLYEADLRKANLNGVNLNGANLTRSNLSGADLSRADLTEAYLYGADLSGANLSGADLSNAYMHQVDFNEADLSGASLTANYLFGSKLSGARIDIKYKGIINPFNEGYDSIIWISEEET